MGRCLSCGDSARRPPALFRTTQAERAGGGRAHRLNTPAGSMRVTLRIAEMAAIVHIAIVSAKSGGRKPRRHHDLQRRLFVAQIRPRLSSRPTT